MISPTRGKAAPVALRGSCGRSGDECRHDHEPALVRRVPDRRARRGLQSQSRSSCQQCGGFAVNIIDVMNDEEAFAPWFDGSSWDAWRIILRGAYALPMSVSELEVFGELAGGRSPPKRRVRELYVVGGRRGGKDSVASLLAVYAATLEEGHRGRLRPGEKALVQLLAVDRDQSKIVLGYIRSYFDEIPDLRTMIVRETRNGFDLNRRFDQHHDEQFPAGSGADGPPFHFRRMRLLEGRDERKAER